MPRIDLFLGGGLGRWALETVKGSEVGRVVSFEADLCRRAGAMGLENTTADANDLDDARGTIAFSVHYPRILSAATIDRYDRVYNLHPGFLPWGRGYYPVFWALFEGDPAGATLHEITPALDKGPIVAQTEVEAEPWETGGELHARVTAAEKELFQTWWPRMVAGEEIPTRDAAADPGSYHSKADFFEMKRGETWRALDAEALLRLLRALTFEGYSALELDIEGRPVEVSFHRTR